MLISLSLAVINVPSLHFTKHRTLVGVRNTLEVASYQKKKRNRFFFVCKVLVKKFSV